ncbi:hypothetical protein MJO29_002361, partial [Puccinia striiformis f. sp. tritici]
NSRSAFYNPLIKMKGNPPITVLISDVSLGTCWPFSGQKGQIGILIKGITILHVSPVLAYDIRTAPRRFELRGIGTGHAEDLDLLYYENSVDPNTQRIQLQIT